MIHHNWVLISQIKNIHFKNTALHHHYPRVITQELHRPTHKTWIVKHNASNLLVHFRESQLPTRPLCSRFTFTRLQHPTTAREPATFVPTTVPMPPQDRAQNPTTEPKTPWASPRSQRSRETIHDDDVAKEVRPAMAILADPQAHAQRSQRSRSQSTRRSSNNQPKPWTRATVESSLRNGASGAPSCWDPDSTAWDRVPGRLGAHLATPRRSRLLFSGRKRSPAAPNSSCNPESDASPGIFQRVRWWALATAAVVRVF